MFMNSTNSENMIKRTIDTTFDDLNKRLELIIAISPAYINTLEGKEYFHPENMEEYGSFIRLFYEWSERLVFEYSNLIKLIYIELEEVINNFYKISSFKYKLNQINLKKEESINHGKIYISFIKLSKIINFSGETIDAMKFIDNKLRSERNTFSHKNIDFIPIENLVKFILDNEDYPISFEVFMIYYRTKILDYWSKVSIVVNELKNNLENIE